MISYYSWILVTYFKSVSNLYCYIDFLNIWKENQTNSRFNKKSIRVWNWNYLYVIRLSLARAVLKHYPSNFDFQIEQKIWNHNSFYLISVRPNTQKTLLNLLTYYFPKIFFTVTKQSQNWAKMAVFEEIHTLMI